MNNYIDVSIIMLTYNHKNYISQAIESVLSQKTSYKYEILIGDDASTDGTASIVEKYYHDFPDKIKAFIRKKNLGPTSNLSELLKVAEGKYIASCEGDDYWLSNDKLQTQIEFLENNPDFIGCAHEIKIVDKDENEVSSQKSNWICNRKIVALENFDGFQLPGHAVSMVYRNIFKGNDLANDIIKLHNIIADRTIVSMLLLQGNIYRIDKTMAVYRYTRRIGGSGATNCICDSKNHFYHEYKYTKRLEKYISLKLGRNIYFLSTRKHFIYENFKDVRYSHNFSEAIYIPLMFLDYLITKIKRVIENV